MPCLYVDKFKKLLVPCIAYSSNFQRIERLLPMTQKMALYIALLLLGTHTAYSQTAEEKLSEIQKVWQTSKEGFLQYRKTVTVAGISRLDIYKRAKVYYLTHQYQSLDEKAAGPVILLGGAGTFKEVHASENNGIKTSVDATYYLHMGVEDGKAELVITCIQYRFRIGSGSDSAYDELLISTLYPVNPQAPKSETIMGAFYATTQASLARLDELGEILKKELSGTK